MQSLKHDTFINEAGKHECKVCGKRWKNEPQYLDCVGVPVYEWGNWGAELFTKKQLLEKGYHPGKPAGAVYRSKSPDGIMWLYRIEDGTPKKQLTEKQSAAAKQNIQRARLVDIHCQL